MVGCRIDLAGAWTNNLEQAVLPCPMQRLQRSDRSAQAGRLRDQEKKNGQQQFLPRMKLDCLARW